MIANICTILSQDYNYQVLNLYYTRIFSHEIADITTGETDVAENFSYPFKHLATGDGGSAVFLGHFHRQLHCRTCLL